MAYRDQFYSSDTPEEIKDQIEKELHQFGQGACFVNFVRDYIKRREKELMKTQE